MAYKSLKVYLKKCPALVLLDQVIGFNIEMNSFLHSSLGLSIDYSPLAVHLLWHDLIHGWISFLMKYDSFYISEVLLQG